MLKDLCRGCGLCLSGALRQPSVLVARLRSRGSPGQGQKRVFA